MFKVGDKVRCVRDQGNKHLTKGFQYIVADVRHFDERDMVYLSGHNKYPGYFASRFELVKEEPKSPIETVPSKRVIKSGTYGKLHVHTGVAHSDMVGVSLTNVDVHGVTWLREEDIDELLFTLTQVREFLKDDQT